MKLLASIVASATLSTLAAVAQPAADPFAENVRTTDPLTPEEQRKTFKLPDGFKIDLVAAEPDIFKPMNMAFDTKGRMWVTVSREYPFPVPLDKTGRDSIKILEDFDENGRARKITTFADGLNIPIGLYPYKNGVIAWSIPNIWFFQDTDGDGKADKREVLYGPFGWERDTHGNQASFRRGFDGWLYATHGYNNISTVRGKDGNEIKMHSGNSYRVRLDGSRVEQHTFGQVNPFGTCFDPDGNLYSADCHSAPIYELLHGAYYPSFGKPHDGLGFGPTMLEHSHGSTAICGIIHYSDDLWPAEYRNNIMIGNVMTSRINRDRLVETGASKTAVEQPDFLSTTDPWFRPVDLQIGPDGALYVADFYNRIIGHYEVPLNHPGRDRERARIWRISYAGKPLRNLPNLSAMNAAQLAEEFRSPNLARRMLAMTEFTDRIGAKGEQALNAILERSDAQPGELVAAAWVLQRLGLLGDAVLRKLARHADRTVRVHAQRILAEDADLGPMRQNLSMQALRDKDALVQRAAAEALSRNPEQEVYVRPLLSLLERVPAEDAQLRHMTRMALRDQLKNGSSALAYRRYKPAERAVIADLCLAIPEQEAADFLIEHIQDTPAAPRAGEYVRHASRHAGAEGAEKLAKFVRATFRDDLDDQLAFFRAMQEGSAQRGAELGSEARLWGGELAGRLLDSAAADSQPWWNLPLPEAKTTANPWFLQQRASADGDTQGWFLCSLPPGGEQLTGVLRSRSFETPRKLVFYLAGHDGVPSSPAQGKNTVRLIAEDDGKVLAQAAAPRHDTAQKVEWELAEHAGKKARVELVDGNSGSAWAWIAAGRFDPQVVPLPSVSPSQVSTRVRAAAEIAKNQQNANLAPAMAKLLGADLVDDEAQAALAGALAALEPNRERLMLAPVLADASVPASLRRQIGRAMASGQEGAGASILADAMRSAPARVQQRLAVSLAGTASGVETLLALAEKGQASPRLLLDPAIQTKISAGAPAALQERVKKLAVNLEPASDVIEKQMEKLRAGYDPASASPERGAQVYAQYCAICHQIGGVGSVIGPQLDGIGARGLERIIEDLADPNRNVDINFRTHALITREGDVITGVLRREEGELVVLADATGKEVAVPKSAIDSRRESDTSIMPSNFGDVIPEAELRDLLAFLLSQGGAARAK